MKYGVAIFILGVFFLQADFRSVITLLMDIPVSKTSSTIKRESSVYDVLKKYKIDTKKVAIELNGKILSKNHLRKKNINDKDIIEIVQFIGGG